MVDVPVPAEFIGFLRRILPGKHIAELYTSIGFYKHGKSEFYRALINHLANTDDQFIMAPGVRGMVMSVFTLPGFNTVFKIIKDRFSPSKNVDRATVIEKYRLVKSVDRVGRMADTQEFADFRFPLSKFDPACLEELLDVAPSTVSVEGDTVLIRHCWTERRMTPLNLYLDNANEAQVREALEDYGLAIKQLAAANIFPGDMLLKNFGVTRHGRVVFYDYDEICFLTEANFRHIPAPRTPRTKWLPSRGIRSGRWMCSRKSFRRSCSPMPGSANCSINCTASCITPITGRVCKRRFAPGKSSTCSPTAVKASTTNNSPVGAAAGCDLLTLIFKNKVKRSQPAAAPTGKQVNREQICDNPPLHI